MWGFVSVMLAILVWTKFGLPMGAVLTGPSLCTRAHSPVL